MTELTKRLVFVVALMASSVAGDEQSVRVPYISPPTLQAPFCFLPGGTRQWQLLSRRLEPDIQSLLIARRGGIEVSRGAEIDISGVGIALTGEGWLRVTSDVKMGSDPIELEVQMLRSGELIESARLVLRPAPPPRPISYYADFGDDFIRIFMDEKTGRFRRMDKAGFDQYFRRLQAHGVSRLIVWQSPFPFMVDPQNYRPEDWNRYVAQARAILDNEQLSAIIQQRPGFVTWDWLRQLLALRMSPEFGKLLTGSAAEHGIALTASYGPFEAALTKYYSVPTFDEEGRFLWDFLPLASPTTNYHPDQIGFAHYRQLLSDAGLARHGEIKTIRATDLKNRAAFNERWQKSRDNLRIVTSSFPPLQNDSFVLQRTMDGSFILRPFGEIRCAVETWMTELVDLQLEWDSADALRIKVPPISSQVRYLWVSNPSKSDAALDLDAKHPVELLAHAGNRIGRENVRWVGDVNGKDATSTRVGAITANAEFHAEFQANEASIQLFAGDQRRSLKDDSLLIDLGELWSTEMLDFNQPGARALAVAELRSIVSQDPFDEIFLNTRTHTQLSGYMADGSEGLQPIATYQKKGLSYDPLGHDRAYAPRSAIRNLNLMGPLASSQTVENITTWQPGEWKDACQLLASPFRWRYARNVATATGVRQLLEDLERAFPSKRIRVVLPERRQVAEHMRSELTKMKSPEGGVYGSDYLRHIIGSLNYSPAFGEGMTLLDLSGLRAEPVFLGIRYLPGREPFKLFVQACLQDMRDNRGSTFRGPRSFFYEAQETLRAADKTIPPRAGLGSSQGWCWMS